MQADDTICASDDVVAREVAGEQVLLNLETGTYFGLNPVGAHVWQALERGPASIAALVDAVVSEFDAERDVVEEDLLALAADLVDNGLVTHQPA